MGALRTMPIYILSVTTFNKAKCAILHDFKFLLISTKHRHPPVLTNFCSLRLRLDLVDFSEYNVL